MVKLFVMLVKLHFDASTPSIHYTHACNYIKTKQRDMHVGQPFNNFWVHSENQLLELSLFIQKRCTGGSVEEEFLCSFQDLPPREQVRLVSVHTRRGLDHGEEGILYLFRQGTLLPGFRVCSESPHLSQV